MRTLDFTPFERFAVGFDRMQRQLEHAMNGVEGSQNAYPPYNIEQFGKDAYRVTLAVAGFGEGDLDMTLTDNTLIVTGRIEDKADADTQSQTFLHRGIAARAFERRFELADHIQVKGAELVNGLLSINLERIVPEEKKPRKIAIGTPGKAIEQKAA